MNTAHYNSPEKIFNTPTLVVNILEDSIMSYPYTLSANIIGGSANDPINDLFGLAFDILFNPSCVNSSSIVLNFSNAFGALNSDYIRIVDSTQILQGKIGIGITRYNNAPITLTGNQILTITFSLTQSCFNSNCLFKVVPHILASNMVDGTPIQLNEQFDSVVTCVVGIEEFSYSNKIDVYPNPSKGSVNILFKDLIGDWKIDLIDLLGNTLNEKQITVAENNFTYNYKTEKYSGDVYFLVEIFLSGFFFR